MDQKSMLSKEKYLQSLYKRHRRGAFVRSGASILMWSSSAVAYWLGFIHADNIISNSLSVLYLILMNPALITYVGVMEPRRTPFIVAGLSCICFGGMLALEHAGVLPTLKINPL